MAKILLGVPTRFNQVEWGCAARAISLATRRHAYTICQSRMSLLPTNCNTLLAQALNFRPKCDYFAMLHSDVEPEEYWLDTLIEQAEAHSADLMSAIVAFKDGTGLTSTAIARPDTPLSTFCRLTLGQIWHEGFPATFGLGEAVEALAKLPAPYGVPSAPRSFLLVNTGCMVYRLSHWQPGVKFANAGQAKEGRVVVEGWKWLSLWDQLIDFRKIGKQVYEPILAFNEHGCAESLNERGVADELKCVAKALLGVQEDRLACQGLAMPPGLWKASLGDFSGFPAPLVFWPAMFEVAEE